MENCTQNKHTVSTGTHTAAVFSAISDTPSFVLNKQLTLTTIFSTMLPEFNNLEIRLQSLCSELSKTCYVPNNVK